MSGTEEKRELNYYKLLNIPQDASVTEIIQAYHNLCRKFSIQPYASQSEISRINTDFRVYKEAYMVLSTPDKRREYDLSLIDSESFLKQNTQSEAENLEIFQKNTLYVENFKSTNSGKNFVIHKENMEKELFSRAKNYIDQEKYHEAINLFKKLIHLNNNHAEYHSYLGIALVGKGWIAYAKDEFKKALELDPDDVLANNYSKNLHFTSNLKTHATEILSEEELIEIEEEKSKSGSSKFIGKLKDFLFKIQII